MNMNLIKSAVIASALLLASSGASAHVWQIGWKAVAGGAVDFYGVSWHGGGISPGSAGSVDDFAARPAGFVINGTNVTFDVGAVFNLSDCTGPAGTSGTCSPLWNAISLDTALASTSDQGGRLYGKYAVAHLDSAELTALGITSGNNSVTLGTFADNVHWANRPFASATVPVNIVVLPPSSGIPEPTTLALLSLGLIGFGLTRRRTRNQ